MNIKRILVIIVIIIILIIGYILLSKLAFSNWNDGVVSKSKEIIRSDLGDEFLFQYETSNFPHLSTTVTIIDSKVKNKIAYFVVNGYFHKPELTTILNSSDIRCYEVYNVLIYRVINQDNMQSIVIDRITGSEPKEYPAFTEVAKALVATKQWEWIKECGNFLLKAGDEDTKLTIERYARGQFSQEELNVNKNSKIDKEHIQSIAEQILTTEQPIALYHGITLDKNDRDIDVIEGNSSSRNEDLYAKYETQFYLYSNGSYLGNAQGKINGRGLDYYWQVDFPAAKYNDEVAISQSYNPYPRKLSYTNSTFPKEFMAGGVILTQVNTQFNVNSKVKELYCIDLDGDGTNEYLALMIDEKDNFFTKCLVDSNNKIIAYLTVFKEKCDDFNSLIKSFNLQDSSEIIDINNDGIMEILMELPCYEGFVFRSFTYKNGAFSGDFITNSSLQP